MRFSHPHYVGLVKSQEKYECGLYLLKHLIAVLINTLKYYTTHTFNAALKVLLLESVSATQPQLTPRRHFCLPHMYSKEFQY